jgi:hypothetical protein
MVKKTFIEWRDTTDVGEIVMSAFALAVFSILITILGMFAFFTFGSWIIDLHPIWRGFLRTLAIHAQGIII